MAELREYSVQEFSRGYDGDLALLPAVTRVVAATPEEAARRVLGEELFPLGEPQSVRAKSWFIDHDGRPLVTMLYGRHIPHQA